MTPGSELLPAGGCAPLSHGWSVLKGLLCAWRGVRNLALKRCVRLEPGTNIFN